MDGDEFIEFLSRINGKSYGEVLTDEKLQSKLVTCLHETFRINGLRISSMILIIYASFLKKNSFFKDDFFWRGKPSDKRINNFFKILKGLQIKENTEATL